MKKLFYLLPVLFFILSCEKEEPEVEKETTIDFSHDFPNNSRDYLIEDFYLYGYNANDEKIFERHIESHAVRILAPADVKKVKVYCVIKHCGVDVSDYDDDWTEKFWVDYITYLIPNKFNEISIDENTPRSEWEPE